MSDEVFGLPGLITDSGTIDFMDDEISEFKKFRASTVHKECFKNWTKLLEYIDYWNNLISEIPEEKKNIMSITENGELKVGFRCLKL